MSKSTHSFRVINEGDLSAGIRRHETTITITAEPAFVDVDHEADFVETIKQALRDAFDTPAVLTYEEWCEEYDRLCEAEAKAGGRDE